MHHGAECSSPLVQRESARATKAQHRFAPPSADPRSDWYQRHETLWEKFIKEHLLIGKPDLRAERTLLTRRPVDRSQHFRVDPSTCKEINIDINTAGDRSVSISFITSKTKLGERSAGGCAVERRAEPEDDPSPPKLTDTRDICVGTESVGRRSAADTCSEGDRRQAGLRVLDKYLSPPASVTSSATSLAHRGPVFCCNRRRLHAGARRNVAKKESQRGREPLPAELLFKKRGSFNARSDSSLRGERDTRAAIACTDLCVERVHVPHDPALVGACFINAHDTGSRVDAGREGQKRGSRKVSDGRAESRCASSKSEQEADNKESDSGAQKERVRRRESNNKPAQTDEKESSSLRKLFSFPKTFNIFGNRKASEEKDKKKAKNRRIKRKNYDTSTTADSAGRRRHPNSKNTRSTMADISDTSESARQKSDDNKGDGERRVNFKYLRRRNRSPGSNVGGQDQRNNDVGSRCVQCDRGGEQAAEPPGQFPVLSNSACFGPSLDDTITNFINCLPQSISRRLGCVHEAQPVREGQGAVTRSHLTPTQERCTCKSAVHCDAADDEDVEDWLQKEYTRLAAELLEAKKDTQKGKVMPEMYKSRVFVLDRLREVLDERRQARSEKMERREKGDAKEGEDVEEK